MYVIIHAYVLFFSCDAIINNIVSEVKLVINVRISKFDGDLGRSQKKGANQN